MLLREIVRKASAMSTTRAPCKPSGYRTRAQQGSARKADPFKEIPCRNFGLGTRGKSLPAPYLRIWKAVDHVPSNTNMIETQICHVQNYNLTIKTNQ